MDRPRRVVGILPTISFVGLFLLLLVVASIASVVVARFGDGGPGMLLLSFLGFAALIAQWLLARRHRPLWPVVLIPCALVLVGSSLLWGEMRDLRASIAEEQGDRYAWFLEGMGENLNLPALAATLASVGFSHAVWLAASRIRRRRIRSRAEAGAVATFALGLMTGIVMLGWRWHQGQLPYGALLLAPVASLLTGLGLIVAVLALRSGAADEDRVLQNTSDFVFAAVSAAASAAMMGVASHSRILSSVFRAIGGESIDPSQKERLLFEGMKVAALEHGFGWTGAAVVLLLGVVALSSVRLVRSVQMTTPLWLTLAAVAVALPMPWMHASALADEAPEYRPGEPGELVADRSVPVGRLDVILQGLTDGVDVGMEAEIRVTGLQPGRWKPPAPTSFSLPPGTRFHVSVGEPYLARAAGPFTMPAARGARLKLGVLRIAPGPRRVTDDEQREPEKMMHVDTSDPSRFGVIWAAGRTVHSMRELGRSLDGLASAVREEWQAHGSHRNDADRRVDTAVIRYYDPPDIDELVRVSQAVLKVERTLRGDRIPAFRVFIHPKKRPERAVDPELSPEQFAGMDPDTAALEIPKAIERCKGAPCPAGEDYFGTLVGETCLELRCADVTVSGLRMKLGEALADRGDVSGARQQFESALHTSGVGLSENASPQAREVFSTVRRPRVEVRLGPVQVNGRIKPPAILPVMEARLGRFRACYGPQPRMQPRFQIKLRFVIGRDGIARLVQSAGSDVDSPEVLQCVLKAAADMSFPQPEGGIATVVAPLSFSPR